MKRRHFLGALSSFIGFGLTQNSYAFMNYQELHDEFVTPYTYQVGKAIITKGNMVTEQHALKENISDWILVDDKTCISKIHELIDNDLGSSYFCEIDGWVITHTEALISAIIVSAV